jgi:hypothetical protein
MNTLNATGLDIRVAASRLILALLCLGVASGTDVSGMDTVELGRTVVTTNHAAGSENSATSSLTVFDAAAWTDADLGTVGRDVFELALRAAAVAVERGDAAAPSTLTVIDFSRPSPDPRMWVFDLRSRELLFQEVVSHGRGSGMALATSFSNIAESNQSSLGLYRTAETYVGKHGYSLRLDGLDKGFNDNARARAIVMHAADYVNAARAKANGYLGRSLGCPAVRPAISRQLIDTIKGGGLVFAYFPDAQWLAGSSYLNP